MRARSLLASLSFSLLALPAHAGVVEITKVTASSTYPPEAGAMYSANMVKDHKLGTSWVEGSPGAGLGQNITLDLAGEAEVKEIRIWGGMWYSTEFWNRANRPREVEVKIADGTKTLCQLKDEMTVQSCALEKPTRTNQITLTFKGAYNGTTWMDTGLSEIEVIDTTPSPWAPIASSSASSTLPDDGDGPYDPARAADGMYDSMWCEGSKDGDGTGEWLQIDFGSARPINSIEIVNGIGGSLTVFKKGNRVANATVAFSDGSTKSITLGDNNKPQVIPVGPKTTSSLKITVDSIVKGTEYNDLCISDVRAK